MNGNILTSSDTTIVSLMGELICNTYDKTNSLLNSDFKYC